MTIANISPRDAEIIRLTLEGKTQAEIGALLGVTGQAIGQRIKKPLVKEEIARRLEVIADKVVQFKLDAIDGAILGLSKLVQLATGATTQEVQRASSVDVVRISGLMPRKRILVEGAQMHGIDDDTKEFIKSVLDEVGGIIDMEPQP